MANDKTNQPPLPQPAIPPRKQQKPPKRTYNTRKRTRKQQQQQQQQYPTRQQFIASLESQCIQQQQKQQQQMNDNDDNNDDDEYDPTKPLATKPSATMTTHNETRKLVVYDDIDVDDISKSNGTTTTNQMYDDPCAL